MQRIFGHGRYANITSTLALVVALGGTSYAVTLPRNSVGSAQIKKGGVANSDIKNNAVTSAKITNDKLTGKDIKESTLGRVPSAGFAATANTATNAASASNASGLGGQPAGAYARVAQPEFTLATLNAGFSNSGPPTAPASFMKDTLGFVHLRGLMGCPPGFATAFTLPPGYRPAAELHTLHYVGVQGPPGKLTIGTDGTVTVLTPSDFVSICGLDGVSFKAER
jgi:hypothetical protein